MELRQRIARIAGAFALLALAGCGARPGPEEGLSVTDLLGRTVTVPARVERVVAIGPGALRLYVYAGNLTYLAGIEQFELDSAVGRPYWLANPGLADLPVIGQGGPNNSPDAERLLEAAPDVILSTYATEVSAADELQSKTGIPVVAISYGTAGFGTTSIFGEPVLTSLDLIGRITGEEERAAAAVAFLQSAQQDLDSRTADIPEAERPTVYVGGLGARGTHGIESTQGRYALLEAIHARNVVDDTGMSGSLMVDREALLEWDPEVIILDQGGLTAVREDYAQNPRFYEALSAVRAGRVYGQLPYNYYSTNIDTAIADAYYLGTLLSPEAFSDIDPAARADEIYTALLGAPAYAQMAADFGGFGPVALSGE